MMMMMMIPALARFSFTVQEALLNRIIRLYHWRPVATVFLGSRLNCSSQTSSWCCGWCSYQISWKAEHFIKIYYAETQTRTDRHKRARAHTHSHTHAHMNIPSDYLLTQWKQVRRLLLQLLLVVTCMFMWVYTGFGLVNGFTEHLYKSLQHFTTHYPTQTSNVSLLQPPLVVSW
jgi:hypothetical protein